MVEISGDEILSLAHLFANLFLWAFHAIASFLDTTLLFCHIVSLVRYKAKKGEHIIQTGLIYPVGGGKGGIGKSFITASLGILLARQGKKVVLVDLDLGAPNLHTFIGVDHLEKGLDWFLGKRVNRLEQIVSSTDIPDLSFVNSGNCMVEAANLYAMQKEKIIRSLRDLNFDFIFLDLGAGTHFNMLDFFLTSNQGIFVLTSEPISIENAFNFIKAVYFRIIKRQLKQKLFYRLTGHMNLSGNPVDQTFQILKEIGKQEPDIVEKLRQQLAAFQFCFLVNQLHKRDDPELGIKVEKVCNRHFHSRFKFLGNIRFDERVHDAVLLRHRFVDHYAHTPTAQDIRQICVSLTDWHFPANKQNRRHVTDG